jgi:PhoH-like ATPase
MADNYTGVKVLHIDKEFIGLLYTEKKLDLGHFDGRLRLDKHQNLFVVLKDIVPKEQGGLASALCRVVRNELKLLKVSNETCMSGIQPRNKEQLFCFEALLDDSVPVVTITGRAGSGKSLLALSAALQKLEDGRYQRIILTKDMNQVGKKDIGFLPGALSEKFSPFNQGYLCNMEYLLGGNKTKNRDSVLDTMEQLPIEFIPLQLIRGASWPDSFIIVDEVQNLNVHETLTVGTRVGENSKIVLLGDLKQRDVKIAKEATGIFKFINSPLTKDSALTASIELIKSERGPVSELFANVLEEDS